MKPLDNIGSKSMKTKNSLYKDYEIGAIPETYYKEYRNISNRLIKKYKISHYMKMFTNIKNDTKIRNAVNQLKNDQEELYLDNISLNS